MIALRTAGIVAKSLAVLPKGDSFTSRWRFQVTTCWSRVPSSATRSAARGNARSVSLAAPKATGFIDRRCPTGSPSWSRCPARSCGSTLARCRSGRFPSRASTRGPIIIDDTFSVSERRCAADSREIFLSRYVKDFRSLHSRMVPATSTVSTYSSPARRYEREGNRSRLQSLS